MIGVIVMVSNLFHFPRLLSSELLFRRCADGHGFSAENLAAAAAKKKKIAVVVVANFRKWYLNQEYKESEKKKYFALW